MILILFWLSFTSCATTGDRRLMPYGDEASRAPADAYAADGFAVRKPMLHQQDKAAGPYEFFYKHCSMNGTEDVYNSNNYDCAGPAY